MKDTILVFCVHCKMLLGEMHYPDIGLQCREICLPCYDRLAGFDKMNESLKEYLGNSY